MNISPIKTSAVAPGENLFSLLDQYLPKLNEGDIVVITSKIVSICEGSIVKNDGSLDKLELIKKEADQFILEENYSRYGIVLTIKDKTLIASAGIDESNGGGFFVLWPKNPAKSANEIWQYLRKKHNINHLGVIITDSHTTPLRWGTTGIGLSWCGFKPLKDYIGAPDIFGRKLKVTKASVLDGLAASAVIAMGEGNEQTPLCLIKDTNFVEFQNKPPTKKEIEALKISPEDDIYHPLLKRVPWEKGNK